MVNKIAYCVSLIWLNDWTNNASLVQPFCYGIGGTKTSSSIHISSQLQRLGSDSMTLRCDVLSQDTKRGGGLRATSPQMSHLYTYRYRCIDVQMLYAVTSLERRSTNHAIGANFQHRWVLTKLVGLYTIPQSVSLPSSCIKAISQHRELCVQSVISSTRCR